MTSLMSSTNRDLAASYLEPNFAGGQCHQTCGTGMAEASLPRTRCASARGVDILRGHRARPSGTGVVRTRNVSNLNSPSQLAIRIIRHEGRKMVERLLKFSARAIARRRGLSAATSVVTL